MTRPSPWKIGRIFSRSRPDSPMKHSGHDGKEAKGMAHKATGHRPAGASDGNAGTPASLATVKVTLHLTVETAQRLGVESAMRRISQSAIAEEVLAAYLGRWQLPSVADAGRLEAG
jgi:hypothetical protein